MYSFGEAIGRMAYLGQKKNLNPRETEGAFMTISSIPWTLPKRKLGSGEGKLSSALAWNLS